MAQDIVASSLAYLTSSSPQTNTDSSPLSSINMSLLEEAESQDFDAAMMSEIDHDRKRKPDGSEEDEDEIEVEPARLITDMMEEIEAYIDDQNNHTIMESTDTRETTLTPSSPDEHDKLGTSKSVPPTTSLARNLVIRPQTPQLSTSLISSSSTSTCPRPSSPHALSLSPQHIFLARIPGSAPLKAHTIAKSAAWFAKLLTDGSGTDLIEMHKTLGLRLYKVEELEAYQQLRSEAATEVARREALDKDDGDTEDDNDGDTEDEEYPGEAGTAWDALRKKAKEAAQARNRAANRQDKAVSRKPSYKPSNNKVSKKAPHNVGLRATTARTPRAIHPKIDNRAYTLRLRYPDDSRFHGNAYYAADGTPKTEKARRKLDEKDRAGAEDVIRVYQ
jgi:hypothetical protein